MKYYKKIMLVSCWVLFLLSCGKEEINPIPDKDTDKEEPAVERPVLIPSPDGKRVLVASHRGNTRDTPENSLVGIQRCIDIGVDIIEVDIRVTLDYQLVLMHDKTLERTSNGSGKVSHTSLVDLKKLYLKNNSGELTSERIPTLEEALDLVKGKDVYLFIDKAEYLISEVSAILKKTGTFRQAIFLDFKDYESAKRDYGSLLDSSIYIPGVHRSNNDLGNYVFDFQNKLNPPVFAFWMKYENSVVLPYITWVKNKKSWIWVTTTDPDQCAGHTDQVSLTQPDDGWGWVLSKGADIINTDYPEKLIAYLKTKNLHE